MFNTFANIWNLRFKNSINKNADYINAEFVIMIITILHKTINCAYLKKIISRKSHEPSTYIVRFQFYLKKTNANSTWKNSQIFANGMRIAWKWQKRGYARLHRTLEFWCHRGITSICLISYDDVPSTSKRFHF